MYEKYAILEPKPQPQDIRPDLMRRAAWMDDEIIPGAPYYEAVWVLKDMPEGPTEHTHDFDEFLGCMGCDPLTDELGATVTFAIGGETMTFTKNFTLFIPAGVPHCPFTITNLKSPVLNYSGGPNVQYLRKYPDGTYQNH